MIRICLCVGHSSNFQGAVNYLHETEFSFNSRIAKKVKLKFDRIKQKTHELVVLHRVNGELYFLDDSPVDLLISLHFNWFEKNVTGTETLISFQAPFKTVFTGLVHQFHTRMVELLGTKDRSIKVVGIIERGYSRLTEFIDNKKPKIKNSCIFEVCFNSDIPGNREIFENESHYVDCLLQAIMELK